MGISGLWNILHPAGQSRSFDHLAVADGFESNQSGKRAYRIGVDASLWFAHASFGKGGTNPELRLLFYRLQDLAQLPILPLFVFDGRERPKVKRGSKMGKAGSHPLTPGLKKLLDVFGMEWRTAIGEAEAELAHLNRRGIIDAVLTDDVDAFVFGALTIIRNRSLSLAGNQSNPALDSSGKKCKNRTMIYTADAVKNHPSIQLTRGGLILIALLSGGDYHEGVPRFGLGTAHALARCGFGDELLSIFEQRDRQDIRPILCKWRDSVNQELHNNTTGFNSRKYPSLSLPSDFPPMDILACYVSPITSATESGTGGGGGPLRDDGEMSLPRLAAFCQTHFRHSEFVIIKHFRSCIWKGAVVRLLRRATLKADEDERSDGVEISDSFVEGLFTGKGAVCHDNAFINRGPIPLVSNASNRDVFEMKIVGQRQDIKNDGLLEYRVELNPSLLVSLTRRGIQSKKTQSTAQSQGQKLVYDDVFAVDFARSQSKGNMSAKPPLDPDSPMRLWLPASMIQHVYPGLVGDF
ncbi:PIN domain-like protein, partial [Artomyces pyxidatus]